MKWILILYICTLTTGECPSSSITMQQFESHRDCVLGGYKAAHNAFKVLEKMEEVEREYIEKEKVVIKFECKGLQASST